MAIGVVVVVVPWGCLYPSFYIQVGKVTKKVTESVTTLSQSRLSLLAYFTYFLIDIIIYAAGSTPRSSGIFWMVGQVIADPSLGLLTLCDIVPRVLILVSMPRVLGK
jgi:hypothetical protein